MKMNGIVSLQFLYYNPTNLVTVSTNQDITSLVIRLSNLETVPVDAIYHFPNLKALDLSNNVLSKVDINAFAGRVLVYVDVSYNKLATLATNSFQSSSSLPVTVKATNNLPPATNNTAFNFASKSISIDVSFNKITIVDPGFSKWIRDSTNFMLNLSWNLLTCDSSIQWMGTFAICPPLKIIIDKNEMCANGELVYNYLIPYAEFQKRHCSYKF